MPMSPGAHITLPSYKVQRLYWACFTKHAKLQRSVPGAWAAGAAGARGRVSSSCQEIDSIVSVAQAQLLTGHHAFVLGCPALP